MFTSFRGTPIRTIPSKALLSIRRATILLLPITTGIPSTPITIIITTIITIAITTTIGIRETATSTTITITIIIITTITIITIKITEIKGERKISLLMQREGNRRNSRDTFWTRKTNRRAEKITNNGNYG